MSRIEPEAYLRHVPAHTADHPANRVAELLPWAVTKLTNRLNQNQPRARPEVCQHRLLG